MDFSIGVNEFAELIGADHSDVSHLAARGELRSVRVAPRGPGATVLDRDQAELIAASVRVGIPWRTAVKISDRAYVSKDGSVVIRPC